MWRILQKYGATQAGECPILGIDGSNIRTRRGSCKQLQATLVIHRRDMPDRSLNLVR